MPALPDAVPARGIEEADKDEDDDREEEVKVLVCRFLRELLPATETWDWEASAGLHGSRAPKDLQPNFNCQNVGGYTTENYAIRLPKCFVVHKGLRCSTSISV